MLWTNYHCHTQFCDGRANAEDFVKAAIDKNISTLGFSSHSPVPYNSIWNMKKENLGNYINEIKRLTVAYKDQIEILTGMEVDYIPGVFSAHESIIQNSNFDFLIGSVHYMDTFADGTPWTIDGPDEEFDAGFRQIFGNDARTYAKRFAEISGEMIELGGFDIVGHIDKVYQHGMRYFDIDEKWYKQLVWDLLSLASEKDLIVEINTKSFSKLGYFYPHQKFFKWLKELNTKVTINSDTHDPEKIDLAFEESAALLLEQGIKESFEFVDSVWQPVSLTEKGVVVK